MSTDRGRAIRRDESSERGIETDARRGCDAEMDPLAMRVVEYPNAPDRCTVYPPDMDGLDRMTHWISADRDAFALLSTHR